MGGICLFALLCFGAAGADEKGFKSGALKEAPPEGVAEKVRGILSTEGIRILDKKGEPFADLWLRKSVSPQEPKQELGVKFGQLPEGTLLAVIRLHQKASDFKGNGFPAGVYTVRNGLQPVDGDHQGVTETRDFLLLSPVKVDSSTEAMSTKDIVKLSVQTTGIKHPTVLHLRKAAGDGAKLPRMVTEEVQGLWILECEVPRAEKGDPVRLGIVLVGRAAE